MIHSMTGFGRASAEVAGMRFDLEVRSVNHRYLDVRVKVPRFCSALELDVRSQVQARFDRGKVDLSILIPAGASTAPQVEVDAEVAAQYVRLGSRLQREHELPGGLDLSSLLMLPGVARTIEREIPEEEARAVLLAITEEALVALEVMRACEGEALERDLRTRLSTVDNLTTQLGGQAEAMVAAMKERLALRAQELREEVGELDEARLHQEVVMAADKLDVTEELVRLNSHVEQFRKTLDATVRGKPAGRRLDFLCQEMAREANTIGSKGNDAAVAHAVVELKTEIERIREQVQNVE